MEAKVRRLSTWETPARVWWAFLWSPQFPVAREYFRPSVMVRVLMANSRLKSCHGEEGKKRGRREEYTTLPEDNKLTLPLSMNFWA